MSGGGGGRGRFIGVALAAPLLFGAPGAVSAQGQARNDGSFWLGYAADWEVRGPWSIAFDTHYTWNTFFVVRAGVVHRWERGPSVTTGYAFLLTNPGDDALSRQEHRPWVQVFLPFRFGDRWTMSERIRGEVRVQQNVDTGVVTSGWIAVQRWRFQTAVTAWMRPRPHGHPFIQLANEVLVVAGPNAGPNYLDQNRASALFGWQAGTFTVRAGYMDRFVPGASGTLRRHQHIVLLTVSQSIGREANTGAEPPAPAPDPEEENP